MLRGPGKAKEKNSTKDSGSKVEPVTLTSLPDQKQDTINEMNNHQTVNSNISTNTTTAATTTTTTTTNITINSNTNTSTNVNATTTSPATTTSVNAVITNSNTTTTQTSKSHNYGIVLHGFLKTRYVDLNNHNKKSIFALKSSWKLRYWRLSLTDEGLVLEKSRRQDTRPYKSILLPFGKTSVWENWGKRGDSRYSFGFTLRVSSTNIQMEAAVDSETSRSRWLNVLQSAFCSQVQDTGELVKYLAQKASNRLSKMTDAGDEHCAKSRSLMNLQATKYSSGSEASASWNDMKPNPVAPLSNINPNQVNAFLATDTISIRASTYTRTETNKSGRNMSSVDDYDWKMFDDHVPHDNFIPRRYNAELYDNEGYMSDHFDMMRAFRSEHDSIDSNAAKGKQIKRSETSPHLQHEPGKNDPKGLSSQVSIGSQNSNEMVPTGSSRLLLVESKKKKPSIDNFVISNSNHATALSILDEGDLHGQQGADADDEAKSQTPPLFSPQKQQNSHESNAGKHSETPIQKSE